MLVPASSHSIHQKPGEARLTAPISSTQHNTQGAVRDQYDHMDDSGPHADPITDLPITNIPIIDTTMK